jgi:hypothetical protein
LYSPACIDPAIFVAVLGGFGAAVLDLREPIFSLPLGLCPQRPDLLKRNLFLAPSMAQDGIPGDITTEELFEMKSFGVEQTHLGDRTRREGGGAQERVLQNDKASKAISKSDWAGGCTLAID